MVEVPQNDSNGPASASTGTRPHTTTPHLHLHRPFPQGQGKKARMGCYQMPATTVIALLKWLRGCQGYGLLLAYCTLPDNPRSKSDDVIGMEHVTPLSGRNSAVVSLGHFIWRREYPSPPPPPTEHFQNAHFQAVTADSRA